MKKVLLLVTALLLLAGCSDSSKNYRTGVQYGYYTEVVIPWDGVQLHCVRLDTGHNHSDDSGLSCDWVRYHKEAGG